MLNSICLIKNFPFLLRVLKCLELHVEPHVLLPQQLVRAIQLLIAATVPFGVHAGTLEPPPQLAYFLFDAAREVPPPRRGPFFFFDLLDELIAILHQVPDLFEEVGASTDVLRAANALEEVGVVPVVLLDDRHRRQFCRCSAAPLYDTILLLKTFHFIHKIQTSLFHMFVLDCTLQYRNQVLRRKDQMVDMLSCKQAHTVWMQNCNSSDQDIETWKMGSGQ